MSKINVAYIDFLDISQMNNTQVTVSGNEMVLSPVVSEKSNCEKPTPTKFVKVEESIFDLKGEFERGELYCRDSFGDHGWIKFTDSHQLALCLNTEQVYRKVEIDWRDELDGYLDSISSLDSNFDERVTLEFSKSKFAYNMSDDEFVAACHLVASLTEKPE